MSHDHLQCDLQMMRHRDTNRMDVKNLDAKRMVAKMKNCVDLTIDPACYYPHDLLDVSLNY